MTKHWKTRHCNHKSTNTKVFITFTKLSNSCFFVWIVHEVYISFQDTWVKFKSIFNSCTIFEVFFSFKHVHKCTVINTMHTQSSYKVTFHHPESFCKQQCIRKFSLDSIYNFTPEFVRNLDFKIFTTNSMFCTASNISTLSWFWIP